MPIVRQVLKKRSSVVGGYFQDSEGEFSLRANRHIVYQYKELKPFFQNLLLII